MVDGLGAAEDRALAQITAKHVPVDGNLRIVRSAVSNSEIVHQLHVMAFPIEGLCSPNLR